MPEVVWILLIAFALAHATHTPRDSQTPSDETARSPEDPAEQ